jgi:hypothetical protein
MSSTTQEILAANPHASHVVFHEEMFAAFGASPCNDFVRIGSAKGVKRSDLFSGSHRVKVLEQECAGLFKKVFELSDPAIAASFRLDPWQIQFIHLALKSINATHLTLFGDEDGVFFNCFDALRFLPEARMNRGHETRVLTHQLRDAPSRQFHITLNAASIRHLPRVRLDLGIGKNKVAVFTDDATSDVYLLRDQEVSLPMVNFFSDRLQEGISLSLVAKSLFQDPDTNQPDSPEWELDEMDLVNQFVP